MNMHSPAVRIAHALDQTTSAFALDVIAGLSRSPKQLAPKYFYDATGSDLFEQITRLPEYYPTRTELGILRDRAEEIAMLIPDGAALVEFGAGATTKARLLFAHSRIGAYVPVDISGEFLNEQAGELKSDFPQLQVLPVVADFTAPFELPGEVRDLPKVGFFPGSTLGNFDPRDAVAFLRSARHILGANAVMIIGIDLEKDARLLYDAYNDAAGVTAQFNLNLLKRIESELGASIDANSFRHHAIYNRERHRIEMHLISRRAQSVQIFGHVFRFAAGESIHTESSYKYSIDRLKQLAHEAGWRVRDSWTDPQSLFSVHALTT